MPFQLERRGQSVDVFIQELHHAIVAAIHVDSANPDRLWRSNVYNGVGRSNTGTAHPSKTFTHAFEKPCSIVIPLIPIIVANELGNSLPVSAVDRMKKMFRVQADLMLGSPKPEQIHADAQRNGQQTDDCSTKGNRHTGEIYTPRNSVSAFGSESSCVAFQTSDFESLF
jgi:hypothetical protein